MEINAELLRARLVPGSAAAAVPASLEGPPSNPSDNANRDDDEESEGTWSEESELKETLVITKNIENVNLTCVHSYEDVCLRTGCNNCLTDFTFFP